MSINPGDLLLVPFPFTDFKEYKKRPVLVVSGKTFNSKTRDLIVCAITSNPAHKDFGVNISKDDLEEGELLRNSVVKTSHLATISKSIVATRIGRLNGQKMDEVLDQLCGVFKE
jgi:mRNA interferase MazF